MKKSFTFLIAALMLLTMISQPTRLWGQTRAYTPAYTLTPASGSNNAYANNCDITCGGIKWNVTGNSQLTYNSNPAWGLGGKKITGVDRAIYSKTAISGNITKIDIYHGDCNITVNSMTVSVHNSSSDAFTGANPIATFSPTFSAGTTSATSTVTVTKQDATSWDGKYYRIVYNVTYANDSNKRLIFAGAVFYKTTYTLSYTPSSAGGTISVTDGEDNEVESGTALEPGTELNIAAEANSGYSFNGWSVTGNSTIGNASSTSTTLTLGSANETLSANFVSAGSYISVYPTSANIGCNGDVAEFEMTTNISTPSYSVAYYTTSAGSETTTKPSWFGDVEFSGNTLDIEVTENDGDARSAYFKVYSGTTYSDIVTINQAAYAPATPTLPAAGNFDYTKEITITVPSGTTVYYTLDGTNPTSSSTEYSAPFTINATKTVKAVAYEGTYPSAVVSATYTRTYDYISDITSANYYTVKGTVVAVNGTNGFVLGDGTGYIYCYMSHSKSVGDWVAITNGHVKNYNHVWEFENGTLSEASLSTYTTGTPAITAWTEEIFNSYSDSGVANLGTYFEVVGTYATTNKEITIAGTEKKVRLSSNNTYSSLNGKAVKAKGYFAGMNTSGTTPTAMYICPESVEAVPVVTTSVTAISNFTYNVGGGPDAKNFTVTGANLTNDITVSTNSVNFEISSDNSNWQTSGITISKGSGTVSATTIYVRLKSGLSSATYNGKITVSSDGADDKEIALTGTVTHVIAYNTSLPTGCSVSSEPNGAQVAGESVSVSATAGTGYKFSAWVVYKTGDTETTVTVTDNAFTMPAYNVTVSATFVPAYTVTYAANGGSGTMTDANSPYIEDAQVTLLSNTFTYAGHTWSSWSVKDASQNDVEVSEGKFTMPASNVTVTAQWTVGQYNVALSSVANVDLLASYGVSSTITEGNNADVDCGTEITLSATNMAPGKVFIWAITDDEDNDVTDDVLDGDVLTVPAYNITIGGQVAELFFKYSGDLTEGDYIIADGSYAMLNTLNSNRFNRQTISPSNNQIIVANASTYLWHIASSGDYWTIYNAAAEKYACSTGSASQANLGGNSDDKCLFSVSGTTTYTFVSKYNSELSTPVNAQLCNGGTYWACYKSGSNTLYKKAVGSKHSVAIATGITNGSVEASPSSAYEGQSVTLTVEPSSGYMLDSWDVYKTGDASTKVTVKGNSFTMPGYDVTVSATFRVQHTYTLVDGSTVTLVPGKHYIIASTNSTNYYVMGAQNGSVRSSVPATLSETKILENNEFYEVVISGDNINKWTMYSVKDEGYLYATGAGSANINVREDNVTTNPTYGQWTISVSSGTATITSVADLSYNKFTYNHNNGNNSRFACYSTAQTAVKLYVRDGDTDLEFYSPTTLASATIAATETYTVESGQILEVTGTLTNNGTAANLIIEDGAQLKFTSTGAKSDVQATVQKNITGYTDDHTGWNFIASPISGSISPNEVTNLLGEQTSNNPVTYNYDLYRFNPSEPDNKGWENYHQHNDNEDPFLLVNGQGYLYAKSSNTTLSFADAIKPYITENNANRVALAPGWNLVGNPYTFNVYSSKSYYAITTVNDENVVTAVNNASTDIAPCTGIIVKNTGNETDYVYFLDEAGSWSTGNNGNLQMVLSQTVTNRGGKSVETLDNAIVSFNEGSQLEKFYFGNQNANIYIPQDKEEYAIVSASAFGELPVNFTANQSGEYTLTFNAEDVEMGYLHLIDNMTGVNIDLLANPSYTFNANVDDYESRFRLVFSAKDVETTDGNADFAFINDGNIIVAGTGTVRVYDITGRMVASSDNANSVSTVGMTPGVYVLQLVNGTETKTQKIIVK